MWALLIVGCSPSPAPSAPASNPLTADERDLAVGDPTRAPREPLATPNHAPAIRNLTLSPTQPTRQDTIHAEAEVTDKDDQIPDLTWRWLVNGVELMGVSVPDLTPDHFTGGDKVQATLVADDGSAQARATSAPVKIANQPPAFITRPDEVTRLDGIRLEAEDPDGDELEWTLTGGPAGLSVSRSGYLEYQGSETERGGKYTVHVRAGDGHGGWAQLDIPIEVSPGSAAPQ